MRAGSGVDAGLGAAPTARRTTTFFTPPSLTCRYSAFSLVSQAGSLGLPVSVKRGSSGISGGVPSKVTLPTIEPVEPAGLVDAFLALGPSLDAGLSLEQDIM